MKRMIILFALVGLTGISAIALGQGGFKNLTDEQILEKLETRLDKRVARLTKKLALTPQQVPKIRQALADGQTQAFELRKSDVKERKIKRTKMKAIRKATRTSVALYLTDGQKAKFKKRGKGKKKLRRLAKRLDLDDGQKVQMKAIFKGKRKEMKALKASGATKADLKSKRREIRKTSMKEFKAILNPVQLEKLKNFRKNKQNRRKKN